MKTESSLRSDWSALALGTCTNCQGSGMSGPQQTCGCVYRGIFRAVLDKFRQCEAGGHLRPLIMDGTNAPRYRRSGHMRKREEYAADVYLAAVRTLTDPAELNLFKYHYCHGADFKLCCQKLGMTRGNFFHACYRVEQKLGKVFQELKPFALYPVDEYFQVTTRPVDVRPIPVAAARFPNGNPLRPPLAARPGLAPAPDPFEAVNGEIRAAFRQGQTLTAICNDLNRRGVRPKRAPRWSPAIVFNITGPRAPAPAPAPVPVPPMPLAPFDITDAAAIANHCRTGFRVGRSLNSLAAELARLNTPAPNGSEWRASDVKHLLMTHPREPGRFKRAA